MKKTFRSLWPFSTTLSSLVILALSFSSHGQITMPVVTVRATDPLATWQGDTATFTFFRDGPTNAPLNVYYLMGGTATNGVDYGQIGNFAFIPAGVRTGSVVIKPINLGQTTTRSVELRLAVSPMMPPVNYMMGWPSNAVAYISTGPLTNIPPVVRIAAPANGSIFPSPANIPICAAAADVDGYVATVEFFAGSNSLGITTNNPLIVGPANPFCLVWSNVPPGTYALRALATDDGGASTRSEPISVTVTDRVTTNYPPLVRLTSPANGSIFPFPATIPLYAYARDPDDAVASVEFIADGVSLGFGSNVWPVASPLPAANPTNIFLLLWSNAPVGKHIVSARATDDRGAAGRSDPITISVVLPPPPITNRPPIVNIVAVDPIAIEGTNCWTWLGLTNTTPTWTNWSSAICRYFTNCGPKNATFLVRRLGSTNDDLTVNYAIGGTATNGVDYVPLSGLVTIPAGERGARINVVPLDDGTPDRNRTVILKLEPSTNSPAGYVLGYPRMAAAMIVDSLKPLRWTSMLADRTFHLNATGPDGAWFRVECSTDMWNWTPVCTNQVINGQIDFVDPEAVSAEAKFYRAVPELVAPPQ